MSHMQNDGVHVENKLKDLHPNLYASTLDQELLPSLGLAIAGVFGAYVLVWLLTLPFAFL